MILAILPFLLNFHSQRTNLRIFYPYPLKPQKYFPLALQLKPPIACYSLLLSNIFQIQFFSILLESAPSPEFVASATLSHIEIQLFAN